MSGGIALDPPVTQVDMRRPVSIKATLRNTGNIHLNTSVLLQASLNGIVVYSAESMLDELPVNNLVDLDFGSFIPQEGGTYNFSLTPTSGNISSDITAELHVGTHAATIFTVEPEVVYPGAAQVRGKIHIEGVGILEGEAENPRIQLIKDAIQKGVDWEQIEVMRWQNTNECNGCHIQSQALVGIEGARESAEINESVAQTLFNLFVTWQKVDGSIDGYPGAYHTPDLFAKTISNLGLWALAAWHDSKESAPYMIQAANYMLKIQSWNGTWVRDHASGWWQDDVSFTSLAMQGIAKAYSISNDQRYLDSLIKATGWLAQPNLVGTAANMLLAHQIMGLNAAMSCSSDETILADLAASIKENIQSLKTNQNSDGGWGKDSSYKSDSLVTAQTLYAILHAGLPGNDPVVLDAIDFLLNHQAEDGSWTSQNKILTTRLAATSWVIISLPIAFEKVRGIDVHADIDSGDNAFLSSFEPLPVSQSGQVVKWELHGVDGTGKDIEFTINLEGIVAGDVFKVVESASISFSDELSGENVDIAIDVPVIRVGSAVAVQAVTNKTEYQANDDLLTSIHLNNVSESYRYAKLRVSIEDKAGTILHNFNDISVTDLDPASLTDWHYRIPLTVNYSESGVEAIFNKVIDFNEVFAELGLQSAILDENSIRVVEIDPLTKNALAIGTKVEILSEGQIKVTGHLEKKTARGGARYFYLYFDISENGAKPPAGQVNIPEPGNFVGFTNHIGEVYIAEVLWDGGFGEAVKVDDLGYYPKTEGIALEDFNNDGFVDIVTAVGSGDIYYLENSGDENNSFLPKKVVGEFYEFYGHTWDYASADFDNDGNKDFVAGGGEDLYLYRGDGNGNFVRTVMPKSGWFRAKFATDFNEDGKIDLFVTITNGEIYYYENIGYGLFATPQLIEDIGYDPNGLVVGDYDTDGTKDIIVSSHCWNGKDICDPYILKGNKDGSFQSKLVIPSLDVIGPASYDAGDFNNDGNLDIIAIASSGKAYYFEGTGEAAFLEPTVIWTSSREAGGISAPPAFPRYKPVVGIAEAVTPTTYNLVWNTSDTHAGSYKVKVDLLYNNELIDSAEAPFEIVASSESSEPVLVSRVATDKIAYSPGDAVRVNSLTKNQSINFAYQDLATFTTITDPAGTIVYSEPGRINYLADGQFVESGLNWKTGQAPKGIYNVAYQVSDGDTILNSASASFEILGSLATGAGITGTIEIPADQPAWGSQPLNYSLANIGNEALDDLRVKILIIDPATDTLLQTLEETLSLPLDGEFGSTLIADTSALAPALYMAVLTVSTPEMETAKTLDSVNFEVIPSLEVSAVTKDAVNFLVWLNDKCSPHQDQTECDDYMDSCEVDCIRSDLLEGILDQTVDNYLLVSNRDDFERELRSPFFTDIMILGDHHPLTDHLDEELREKVHTGLGLISSLWAKHASAETIFGIKVAGKLANDCSINRTVELVDSDLTDGDIVAVKGRVHKVTELNTDRVVAGWISDEKSKNNYQYPAAVIGEFGKGRSLYLAFDLGLTLSEINRDQLAGLLADTIAYVHTPADPGRYLPYRMAPVTTRLKSLGGSFRVKLTDYYDNGLTLFDPATYSWVAENPKITEVMLGVDEERDMTWFALLPEEAGTYPITTEVGLVIDDEYTYFDMVYHELRTEPAARELVDAIGDELTALQGMVKKSSPVKNAITHFNKARDRVIFEQNDIEKNIHDIETAITALLAEQSVDVSTARSLLAELLRIEQARWYLY